MSLPTYDQRMAFKIALAIPHLPGIPKRDASFVRLKDQLRNRPTYYRELTDKAPNNVWSVAMWEWMLTTGADFCLTLQDDVMVAPCFWPALRAMVANLPRGEGQWLGLSGVHPVAKEVARRGHHWYRTQSWIIGWAYGMWRDDLAEFFAWRTSEAGEAYAKRILPAGEDAVINFWLPTIRKGSSWHPTPSICDHDVSIDSSYDNDDHGHRRPWVTWHGYGDELTRPDFWLVNGKAPQLYPTVAQHMCWGCGAEPAIYGYGNGVKMGARCIGQAAGAILGKMGGA